MMPEVFTTIAETRDAIRRWRFGGLRVALVPTMGALHEGHLELVRRARREADAVIVSIFVNPLQFGEGEDLDAYPRTLDADVQALAGLADAVFAPSAREMYPGGPDITRVIAGPAGSILEGAHRPGHFDGVLTVVSKLFNIAQPDIAVFGEKDAQQLFLVRSMVRDLNMPVEIVGVPIVREPDGLARSSRNRYLSAEEHATALTLSRALQAGAAVAGDGVDAVLAACRGVLSEQPTIDVDYVALVDRDRFAEVTGGFQGEARILIAARVGTTRLIDNLPVLVGVPGA